MSLRASIQSLLLAAAVAMVCLASPQSAKADSDDFALSVTLSDSPYYSADRWTPVRVQAINRSPSAVTGQVNFAFTGQSERDKVKFRLPLTVQARSAVSIKAYVFIPVQPLPASKKKDGGSPPICIADWYDNEGKRIGRGSILGAAVEDDFEGAPDRVHVDRPFIMSYTALFDAPSPLPESAIDQADFAALFQSAQGTKVMSSAADVAEAPRDVLGYDATAIVMLDGSAARQLDAGQQRALIDFMSAGGAVVLADPLNDADLAASWLEPYLPVRKIGSHFADFISVGTGEKAVHHKMAVPLDICEWTADPAIAGATIVAADAHYVHAAYQRVGLGRLIVTSFPPNAFDPKDPATKRLWASLFNASPTLRFEESQLAAAQGQFLQSMVGLKVPPWGVAAAVVLAYVLIVLAIQLIARQGRRPAGFAAAVAAAIVIALGLVVFSFFRDRTVALSLARIDVIDLDRGGVRNEGASLLGPSSDKFPLGVVSGASLRQAASADSKSLDLSIAPLKADKAEVYPGRIANIWQTSAAVPPEQSLHVKGRFDEQGVALAIDNHIGPLAGAVLIGGSGRFTLPTLAAGASNARADDGGLAQSALQLDAEQLRGKILDAVMTPINTGRFTVAPRFDDSIYLAGWLTDAPPPLLQLPPGQTPAATHDNTLVRTRMEVEPSPIGSKVHVSKAFTQMVNSDITALPYEAAKREWVETFISSDFLVGFAYPSRLGRMRPTRVTIDLQANTPQQTLTLRRGQVEGGNPHSNPRGEEIATWNQLIGSKSVSFDVSPDDIDTNGWVWLKVTVEGPAGATQARWKFQELSVSYDGVIDGPPQAPVMPRHEMAPPIEPTVPGKRPPVVKKPAATKPAKKPSTKPAPVKKPSPTP